MRRSALLTAAALVGILTLAGCSSPSTGTPPAPNASAEEVEAVETEAPATAQGTRENPLPVGSTVESDDWSVVINSVTLAANDAVVAANMMNEAPDAGTEYIVINYTATYKGADADGQMAAFVAVEYVTAAGATVDPMDKFVVAPDPAIDNMSALYTGGATTGNAAIQVPSPVDGVLAVRPGMMADKVFVAVQ